MGPYPSPSTRTANRARRARRRRPPCSRLAALPPRRGPGPTAASNAGRGDRRHRTTGHAHRRTSRTHLALRDFGRPPTGRRHHPRAACSPREISSTPASRSTASTRSPMKRASPMRAPRSPAPRPRPSAPTARSAAMPSCSNATSSRRQHYDDALSAAGSARADVRPRRAALSSAAIDLSRTISAPRFRAASGDRFILPARWSRQRRIVALTTIQRLDPIYVDIQQSSADLLRLREQMLAGQVAQDTRTGPASARNWLHVPARRNARLRRCDRRSRDRVADHPRGLSQSAASAASRHVRPGPAWPGHPVSRHPCPAARRQPGRARPPDGLVVGAKRHGRAAGDRGRSQRRNATGSSPAASSRATR